MTEQINKAPSQLGFYMPPEWHPHDSTWLAWPHNKLTWENIEEIEETYVEIIKAIHHGETVNILVNNKEIEQYVKNKLINKKIDLQKINFFVIPTADAWIRDYGPNFIINKKNNEIAFNKWLFNAWGNKYDDLLPDNIIPFEINKYAKMRHFEPNIVLEGGSIDVNGKGLCATTEQCLLNKNRNPNLKKSEIENYLKNYLGVSEILWLKNGIEGEDTDGHVDDIARFVNENTILVCCPEENNENYGNLRENFDILSNYRVNGRKFNIAELPMPEVNDENGLLPASYANFYIGNNTVLVPIFGHPNDKNDKIALKIIQKFFPQRKIFGINCRKLVYGFGAIHCITQQQPKIN